MLRAILKRPRTIDLVIDPNRPLLYSITDELNFTGTKYGCGEGQCGVCTVMIDGIATRSCQTGVASVAAGASPPSKAWNSGQLHPLQKAFLEVGAM